VAAAAKNRLDAGGHAAKRLLARLAIPFNLAFQSLLAINLY
jgi:hypothetical protein